MAQPATVALNASSRTELSREPDEAHQRAMVVPRMKGEDILWMQEHLPNLRATIYMADDSNALLHSPKNKGHEVMIYLTFIIDQYDQLPDVVLFMHAHRYSHHNSELLGFDAAQMVQRLSDDYVVRQGYVNMRCDWSPGCPEWLHPGAKEDDLAKQEQAVLTQSWHELFPHDPLPEALGQACCAQFALSKARILSIPKSRYVYYRDWIMRTPLSDYISGRIWEYTWQFLFTGRGVFCPVVEVCHCDGFGVCFGGQEDYRDFETLRHTKQEYQSELKSLKEEQTLTESATNIASTAENGTRLDEGRLLSLNDRIEALDNELTARKKAAIDRGNDQRRHVEVGIPATVKSG